MGLFTVDIPFGFKVDILSYQERCLSIRIDHSHFKPKVNQLIPPIDPEFQIFITLPFQREQFRLA